MTECIYELKWTLVQSLSTSPLRTRDIGHICRTEVTREGLRTPEVSPEATTAKRRTFLWLHQHEQAQEVFL